jgi:5-methylcytosine-specific restriction endonuclease McrA
MPFGSRNCLWCGKTILLTISRDIKRKKYCSHSCRQKDRFNHGEWTMNRLWGNAHTPEANAKKGHKGSEHPQWIPDRSMVKFRRRYEMTKWTRSVFERDDFTCQSCGVHGGKLQAHHIKSYSNFPDERWNIGNGVTLCISCHKKTPNYGGRYDRAF